MTDHPKRPSEGGSYIVDAKGKLVRTEHTIGPLDPDHPDQKPKAQVPVEPPLKEA